MFIVMDTANIENSYTLLLSVGRKIREGNVLKLHIWTVYPIHGHQEAACLSQEDVTRQKVSVTLALKGLNKEQ